MATVTHVLSGAGAPTAAPPSVGAHYVNTTNGDQYLAKGTASAADWVKPGGSAPSEVLRIEDVGTHALGSQHAVVDVPLFYLPDQGATTLEISPEASRQFDINVRASPPNGQSLSIIVTGGLADGISVTGASREYWQPLDDGFLIDANTLSGDLWARIYFNAVRGTLDLLVFSDAQLA
ncbi:hypothetical protein DB376_02320 [Pseudomonas aeruginosa]|uniref:hypothetical protein n=1 Tax=Pseudomonas aeruginosa TaxID=287 RepID=UPI000D37172D|nr:hypothetical protein [Pseudomonas aeruginosa]PTZ73776.1 hypothetical protein DB376_02320 [Pseudomonas aeruginosa]